MFRLPFFLLVLLVSGCASVQFPMPIQVAGEWENINFFYSRLELDSLGNGYLVVPAPEAESTIFRLTDFKTDDCGFSLNMIDVNQSDAITESVRGKLYESGALCISDLDEYEYCFMKIADIEKSRSKALQILEKLNNKARNSMDGSSEPPIR